MRKAHWLKTPLLAIALTASLAACSAIEGRQTAGEDVDGASSTTKAQTAILADPNLKVRQGNVEPMDRVVQLSGFVDTPQAKTRASQVARNVSGVRDVRNNLVVR